MYKQDHKFDLLANPKGRIFALRLYLDLAVHELVGNHPNETHRFFANLVHNRYRAVKDVFTEDSSPFCESPIEGKIPSAQHVVG